MNKQPLQYDINFDGIVYVWIKQEYMTLDGKTGFIMVKYPEEIAIRNKFINHKK